MLCPLRSTARQIITATTRTAIKTSKRSFNGAPPLAWQRSRSSGGISAGSGQDAKADEAIAGRHGGRVDADFLAITGVVATSSPQRTTIAQLLDHIPARDKPTPEFGQGAELTMLLTPAFAHDAMDPDLPLELMRRLQGSALGALPRLETYTAAVVDRLPSLVSPDGTEGLAYMLRSTCTVAHERPPAGPYLATAEKPGALTFYLPVTAEKQLCISLPLAHTIFSTGRVSTIVNGTFTYDESTGELAINHAPHPLHTQPGITLPGNFRGTRYELSAPLQPLTPLRTIRNTMGNIIRSVSASSPDGLAQTPEASQPASQELEAAVSAYFEARDLPPAAVNVWALVAPGRQTHEAFQLGRTAFHELDTHQIRRAWKSASDLFGSPSCGYDDLFNKFFEHGGRLHRVLSGGGGWGKKAGLLSLDPDSNYNARTLRSEEGWNFDFDGDDFDSFTAQDMEKQQKQALGTIVEEGEEIMFFIAPSHDDYSQTATHLQLPSGHDTELVAVFGVISSSIDTMPGQGSSESGSESPETVHVPSLFGGFSEGGMALEVNQTTTKFDVPGARLLVGNTIHAVAGGDKQTASIDRSSFTRDNTGR